tara:strand:+ start:332 stop:691 length:360 start_codon:yes stop_codon:yes gene_type:complete
MLGFSSISELAFAQLPNIFAHASGVSGTATLGEEGVSTGVTQSVTGFSITVSQGDDVTVIGKVNISVTGISGTLSTTSVIVWGMEVPAPGTEYTTVSPSSSPSWTTVDPGSTQTWTEVA